MSLIFPLLWKSYPADPIVHADPKTGEDVFDNHCAINLSECLLDNGVKTTGFKGATCWNCPSSRRHIIRAEEMAHWLRDNPFPGIGSPERFTGSDFVAKTSGRAGILFLKDYWRRGTSEASRTGDHIDLWNGSRMTDWVSYFRAQWGISWDGYLSDYRKATQVWFWEMR